MFKKISILTKLIPTARTVIFNSQRTMQTNYGDYVRFLELVGNVKVSELLVTDNLNENKNKKKNISRSFAWDFTCDDDIWLMVNRRGLEFLLIMNIPCFIFFYMEKVSSPSPVQISTRFQRFLQPFCSNMINFEHHFSIVPQSLELFIKFLLEVSTSRSTSSHQNHHMMQFTQWN